MKDKRIKIVIKHSIFGVDLPDWFDFGFIDRYEELIKAHKPARGDRLMYSFPNVKYYINTFEFKVIEIKYCENSVIYKFKLVNCTHSDR